MARTKAPSNFLDLVASDSEDDLGEGRTVTKKTTAATRKPSIRDMAAPKRGRPSATMARASAAASKVTKPAAKKTTAATRRAEERKAAAAAAAVEADEADAADEAASARDRRVLADRTNEQDPEPAPAKGKGRSGRKAAAEVEETTTVTKKRGRGRPKAAASKDEDEENEENAEAPTAARKRGAKKGGRAAAAEAEDATMADEEDSIEGPEIPETQFVADGMDVDEDKTEDVHTEAEPSTITAQALQSPLRRNRPPPQPPSSAARGRSGASDAAADATVRRRLGDMTKKCDQLESRFRDLRDIGVKEAERNFDRLKKQGDDRVRAANDLIASLRAEVATYRDLAKQGDAAQREKEAEARRNAELAAEVARLTTALGDARAEAKTLATKLAAARTSAEAVVVPGSLAVPGSAIKASAAAAAAGPSGSAARAAVEALQATSQQAQLKEDLYGDLTGLLVRSAKRDGAHEMYDCIQTGRNGSLHFKLSIDGDDAAYDGDAQFVYTPQLDSCRDVSLTSRLPDYLVEEISFPRAQAAKFYKRVMQSLSGDA